MRILILLVIIGVLVAAVAVALYFVSLKPWKEWEVEVNPSDEIVIKGPVGRIMRKNVWLKCTSGENVTVSLSVVGLSHAHVKPTSLSVDEGDVRKAVLVVKISKAGVEKGKLKVEYGAKLKEVKVKVVGLPPPKPGGREGEETGGQTGGQVSGGEGGTVGRGEQLKLIIHAEVTVTGDVSGVLLAAPLTTYNSSFTTRYKYSWIATLYKVGPVEGGTRYEGVIELIEVSEACTERYYHQLTRYESGEAEVTVTISGCQSKMPEGQSLETSLLVVIDSNGRIVELDYAYAEWYLGEVTGMQNSKVVTLGRVVSGTKSVTDDLWLSGAPIEFLVEALKPKPGEKVTGSTVISSSDYIALAHFYGFKPEDNPPIYISGTLEIVAG